MKGGQDGSSGLDSVAVRVIHAPIGGPHQAARGKKAGQGREQSARTGKEKEIQSLEKEPELLRRKKNHLESRACQEQSRQSCGHHCPQSKEIMTQSGLRKIKSLVFNDSVPIITLKEPTTS